MHRLSKPVTVVVVTAVLVGSFIAWLWSHDPPVPKRTQVKPLITHHVVKPAPRPKATPVKTKRVTRAKPRATHKYHTATNTPAKRYARGLVSPTQYACLHELWMRESGWSPTSNNPTSSAYGIPQILGLEARTGNDYRAQVRAGLDYIDHRYRTPCKAWAFWTSHRWY